MWSFLFLHTPLFYLTQSIWRDEAFSILLAQRPLTSFITTIAFEPPVYYVLLHYWIRIFGTSEIAVRSLSLLGFSLAVLVIIIWAKKLFRKHWLSWFLPVFFFFNPMLLYYAFEVRSYGWYMFFTVLSLFAYIERRLLLYIIATTLGLYTHTYMVFVVFVQILHAVYAKKRMFPAFVTVALLYSPWLIKIIREFSRLKESWYFPVDLQLIKSVLGNVFLGFEGTPWYLWQFTAVVSLFILAASIYALLSHTYKKRNTFFFLLAYIPLVIIIGISFYKPLFVNRYVLPVTIAEIFLIVFAIERIQQLWVQKTVAAIALLFVLGFNVWFPGKYAKLDIRLTVEQINAIAQPKDFIATDNPLILFETMYYSNNSQVYWYNPTGSTFPWYVGEKAFSKDQIMPSLPSYPHRAFIIHADGTYEIGYNTPLGSNL